MNGAGADLEGDGRKLGGFYTYKNTFNKETIWVDVPSIGMGCMSSSAK